MQQKVYIYIFLFYFSRMYMIILLRIPLFRYRRTDQKNESRRYDFSLKKNIYMLFFLFTDNITSFPYPRFLIARVCIAEFRTISPKEQAFELQARNGNSILIQVNIENRPLLTDSLKTARQGLFLSPGAISLY